MRRILLDANLLIAVFDENSSTEQAEKAKAKQTVEDFLSDEEQEVALVITPLIRYETLRSISWDKPDKYNKLRETLDNFEELDINREISEIATNLLRFYLAQNPSLKINKEKRKFDTFHFASAKHYDLELASQDSDIAKLENLYQNYLALT